MNEATPEQRQRSAALVALMIALAVSGSLSRVSFRGREPAPCATPGIVDGELHCDGGERIGARAWLVGAKLDVNTATQREMEAIPGIGPSTARAILELRAQRGRFATMDEIDDVNGIGPKTLEKLRAVVDVK